jgi:AmmeMemoRadiSam system protein B
MHSRARVLQPTTASAGRVRGPRFRYDRIMANPLPRLRTDLEFMPSPIQDHPGVFIRDPYHYTEAAIIVPPLLAQCLAFFDGQQTDLDLQAHLVRQTGQIVPSEVVQQMIDTLAQQGFLHTKEFEEMKQSKREAFRGAPLRPAAHAGSAYPNEDAALRQRLDEFTRDGTDAATADGNLIALAAPHVSPEGGWRSYAAAYRRLDPDMGDRTFVILGTSHYGAPEKFGLTRKPFVTPLGKVEVDTALVDELCKHGGEAVEIEDYCHSIEHSIEFQCIFLQHRLGSQFKILPILCGPLAESLMTGRPPETNENVRRFFEALGEIGERHGRRLFWILGIDLAHIGRRYGDSFAARAGEGRLAEVHRRDGERLDRICAGDPGGFFELVRPGYDELRWCGYSPLYTFLLAMPGRRGRLLNYEQWNIDAKSVVSFAAIEFTA